MRASWRPLVSDLPQSTSKQPHDLTHSRHCPSGVAEPTAAPAQTTAAPSASASHSHDDDDHDHAVTASTCEAHDDHWHCPSGVAEPTTAPAVSAAVSSSARTTASGAGAAASSSAPAQQSTNAGAAIEGGQLVALLGAVGAYFL